MLFNNALLTSAVLVGGLGFSVASYAAPITLNPSDFSVANGTTVSDNFGDTADINFTWSVNGNMFMWNDSYSGEDAFYCGSNASAICVFNLEPLGGASLTLISFELGNYLNRNRLVPWSIFDLDDLVNPVSTGTAEIPTPSNSPFNVTANVTSTTGFQFRFGPDGWNNGLTSLTYTINDQQTGSGSVPAPGTLELLGLGLLGFAAKLRRRVSVA
ncbi:PEP-CTERM sorting domain-containing protein [Methylotuvimicrobium sp. KM2]|uniref:PEP-CTERM sorting domain-containing protein n=1 Tax=Methylotuvimicrobium sp. KM2 TaxID=3133976 RepID=UPI003101152D